MQNSLITTAIFAVISSVASLETHAVALNYGDVLTITTGQELDNTSGNISGFSGSYFAVDTRKNGVITDADKLPLSQGTTGLVIGVTSSPGAYGPGSPGPGDSNAVTAPNSFMGATGSWYFDIAPTGSTETGLNTQGWDWAWNTLYSFGLGGLAWQPSNCESLGCSGYTFLDGVGRFQWDGVYGHSYTLDITSTPPADNRAGFGGYGFYTHLEGTVTAVPEPSPAWLFGSALLVMFGIARYRKA